MPHRYVLLLLLPLFLLSCEKAEEALVLPPPSGASHAVLDMGGPLYNRQLFFNFDSGKAVFVSDPACWDLAFESGSGQRHVFMNGGQNVYLHNTHKTAMDEVTELPPGLAASGIGWDHDMPCGMSDSTGIGDWFRADGSSKGEVYVIQLPPPERRQLKLRILGLSGNTYRFEWAPISARGSATAASIAKDTVANFSYFSFASGQVFPEPAKETWDVVFTRYRHIFREHDGYPIYPYVVSGVLSNPMRTRAVADSLTGFENITRDLAQTRTPSVYRDAIGFAWKYFNGISYNVKRINCYVVWTQRGSLFKLHFLDFTNSAGQQGYPSMEYLKLQ